MGRHEINHLSLAFLRKPGFHLTREHERMVEFGSSLENQRAHIFHEKSYARHEVLNGRYREDRQAAAVEFSSQMLTA
jgi:hypothetical protein